MVKREKAERTKLERYLKAKEDEVAEAHADLVKYKDRREKLINSYISSTEFRDLMTMYDETIYPANLSIGWNSALKDVQKKFSQLKLSEFPRPEDPVVLMQLMVEQESEAEEEREEESNGGEEEEEVEQDHVYLIPTQLLSMLQFRIPVLALPRSRVQGNRVRRMIHKGRKMAWMLTSPQERSIITALCWLYLLCIL